DHPRLDVSRVRGAVELRLPPGDAALRPLRAGQGDADFRWRDRTHGAGGPLCRVRVGRTGSQGHAAVSPQRHRQADRPLEGAGTRQGGGQLLIVFDASSQDTEVFRKYDSFAMWQATAAW